MNPIEPLVTQLIEIRPRAGVVHVSRGRSVLALGEDGTMDSNSDRQGLFVYQTRTLSEYRWTIDGKQPRLSVQSPVLQHSWLGYYFQAPSNCKDTPTGECNPLQQTIELKVSRVVGEGMHEDVQLTNHTQITTSLVLALNAGCDFAARQEIKDRKQQGRLRKHWTATGDHSWDWSFDYEVEHHYEHQGNSGVAHLHRGMTLHLRSDSDAQQSGDVITFQVTLQPHATWNACLMWQPVLDDKWLPVERRCNALTPSSGEWSRKQQSFLARAARISTPASHDLSSVVQRVLERSRQDLAALRLYDLDDGEHNWKLAAGIPSYLALFGRDMLTAAWQSTLLSTEPARGALSLMRDTQAHETNEWRDEQPGRMLHEAHSDPLSVLNFNPKAGYYGTANTPFLVPIVAVELWHWTGNKDLVRPYVRPGLEALAWADKYLMRDSGFYKYATHSEQGMKNQGWKDSSDAIVYPDGSQVADPLGTAELQAFAYAAKLHFSELLWWLGDTENASRLFREAREFQKKFAERFWMEDEGYLAMAIDKDDRPVGSIASDAGLCVLSGIVDGDLVPRIIARMMEPDLFSGWGVRTLSTEHPAFNPFAYHRGTVWPVENGCFVLAMARYGLKGEMWQLSRALFEAATLFQYQRLPEVFGGHARDAEHPFPCLYEKADSPQAWSASVPFAVLQALLGIYPFAPMNVLFVDPHLPDWLPEITIENLAVGNALATLHFARNKSGNTDVTTVQLDGDLHLVRQPSPWSLTANGGERIRDLVSSLIPGKRAV